MNFLAHFHLSHQSEAAVLGGLLGDFVKGRAYQDFPAEIAQAILLHRRIDSFTDGHEFIRQSKSRLAPPFRRYSGIVLDLFFDHYLATHWEKFSSRTLESFCNDVYRQLNQNLDVYPDDCRMVVQMMSQHDWLTSYRDTQSIERALKGISRRLSRKTPVADAIIYLSDQYADFEQDFLNFYPLLCVYSEEQKQKIRNEFSFNL